MRIILISPTIQLFIGVNGIESSKFVSVTFQTQVPPGVYLVCTRSLTLYLAVTLAVPSSIHPAPNPRWRFPNGDVQPNRLLPEHIQRQQIGKLRSKHIRFRSSLHLPGPLLSNLELLAEHHSGQSSCHHRHEGSHRYYPP